MVVKHDLLKTMEDIETVATDTNVDVEEATNSNEDSGQEDTVSKEDYEKLRQANLEINNARKRAEAEIKQLKSTQTQSPINNDPFFEERLELLASGLSREEIEKAKVIAKGNGTTLQEAIKDDMFITYQNKLKDDRRKEDAKLGASKGSGESKDNTLIKQDMSREEHQEAFKKING